MRPWKLLVPAMLLALAPPTAHAQIPEEFTNLKVLPEDIDQRELVATMRGFAGGLGVRCWYCHMGEEGKPLSTFDFASDEKHEKQVARAMIKMVREINTTVGKIDTGHEEKVEVSCATCHHGLEKPQQLRDILVTTYEEKGLDGAMARYDELREKYYGRYAYDFGPGPLNMFMEFLAGSGKADEALQVQERTAEFHPDDTFVQVALGQAYERGGDRQKAMAAYRRALEIDPSNGFAKSRLEVLQNE